MEKEMNYFDVDFPVTDNSPKYTDYLEKELERVTLLLQDAIDAEESTEYINSLKKRMDELAELLDNNRKVDKEIQDTMAFWEARAADTEDQDIFVEAVEALEENESEVECKVCYELFPKEKCVKTAHGYICPVCNQELQSHQGTNLDLIDSNPFSLDYEDPRDPEEEEPKEILDKPVDANEMRKHEAGIKENKLEESQAQEIGDTYKRLSKLYNVDLEELVYGEDGFMKSCYPNGFPDFAGDVIYSQEYWDEFEKWLKETKGIILDDKGVKNLGEVKLDEHVNDCPPAIESDQKLQGVDNAVVDCKKYTLVAHSEDEKPVDCKLEKPALEEPLAGKKVDVKLYEAGLRDIIPDDVLAIWDRVIAYANKEGIPNSNGNFINYADQKACIDAVCTEAEKQMLRTITGKDGNIYSAYQEALTEAKKDNEELTEDIHLPKTYKALGTHFGSFDIYFLKKGAGKFEKYNASFSSLEDAQKKAKEISNKSSFSRVKVSPKNDASKVLVAYASGKCILDNIKQIAKDLKLSYVADNGTEPEEVEEPEDEPEEQPAEENKPEENKPEEQPAEEAPKADAPKNAALNKARADYKKLTQALKLLNIDPKVLRDKDGKVTPAFKEVRKILFAESLKEDLYEIPWAMQQGEDGEPEYIGFAKSQNDMLSKMVKDHSSDAIGENTYIYELDEDTYLYMKNNGDLSDDEIKELDKYFGLDENLNENWIIQPEIGEKFRIASDQAALDDFKRWARNDQQAIDKFEKYLGKVGTVTYIDSDNVNLKFDDMNENERLILPRRYLPQLVSSVDGLTIVHEGLEESRKSDVRYKQVRAYESKNEFDRGYMAVCEEDDDGSYFDELVADGSYYAVVLGNFSCQYGGPDYEWDEEHDDHFIPIKVWPNTLNVDHLVENLNEAKKDDELPVDPEAAKLEVHTMLNDLVADEIEAVNGYEEAKAEIMDAPISHKDTILDTIDHIEDEEKEHIDELIDATTEIPFDKEEAPAPVAEEPVVEEEPLNQDFPEVEENLEERVDLPAFDSDVKVGDSILIVNMEGEPDYCGRKGKVDHIDSLGQLHGSWGGLAVIPGVDKFDIITDECLKEDAKAPKYKVVVSWEGTFCGEKRVYKNDHFHSYEFDHEPTKQEVEDRFYNDPNIIRLKNWKISDVRKEVRDFIGINVNDDGWKDIKLTGYKIITNYNENLTEAEDRDQKVVDELLYELHKIEKEEGWKITDQKLIDEIIDDAYVTYMNWVHNANSNGDAEGALAVAFSWHDSEIEADLKANGYIPESSEENGELDRFIKPATEPISVDKFSPADREAYIKCGQNGDKEGQRKIAAKYQHLVNEASSAETRAYKNGGKDADDLIQGKAIARIKDPAARDAAVAAVKAGRPEVAKQFYGDRKEAQALDALNKKQATMAKAGTKEECLKEGIEYNKFSPEEQAELGCDEDGYYDRGRYVFDGWCGDIFDESDCRYEADFGWLCPQCQAALKSRGEQLTFIENESLEQKHDEDKWAITIDGEQKFVGSESEMKDKMAELEKTDAVVAHKVELVKGADILVKEE